MTDTQVKYWTLKETERANRANENIRQGEVDVNKRKVDVDEDIRRRELHIKTQAVENEWRRDTINGVIGALRIGSSALSSFV